MGASGKDADLVHLRRVITERYPMLSFQFHVRPADPDLVFRYHRLMGFKSSDYEIDRLDPAVSPRLKRLTAAQCTLQQAVAETDETASKEE